MTHNMQYPAPDLVRGMFEGERNKLRAEIRERTRSVFKLIEGKNLSIAFAESVTGGLLMSQFVQIPGVSEVLKGGVVCYQPEVKINVLNVPKELIEKHSAESNRTSTAIAEGLKKRILSEITIGITGLASPGANANEDKPVGSIFLTIIYMGHIYQTTTIINGNRWMIRHKACLFTLNEIEKIITDDNYPSTKRITKRSITTMGRWLITYNTQDLID